MMRLATLAVFVAAVLLILSAVPAVADNDTRANATETPESDEFGPVQHDFGDVRIGEVHEVDGGIRIEVEADRPTSIDWTAIDAQRYGSETIGTETDHITIPHRSAIWLGYDGELAELDYRSGGELLPSWVDPRAAWLTGIVTVAIGVMVMVKKKQHDQNQKRERKA